MRIVYLCSYHPTDNGHRGLGQGQRARVSSLHNVRIKGKKTEPKKTDSSKMEQCGPSSRIFIDLWIFKDRLEAYYEANGLEITKANLALSSLLEVNPGKQYQLISWQRTIKTQT